MKPVSRAASKRHFGVGRAVARCACVAARVTALVALAAITFSAFEPRAFGQEKLRILPSAASVPLPSNVKVFFRPAQDLEAAVVTALNQAHNEILVNQLAVTSPAIARALVDAYQNPKRKVFVGIILDENPPILNYQAPEFFTLNRIPFVYAATKGRNSLAYCVIDRRIVLTGYEWLASSVSNNASLLVLDDPGVASTYVRHWLEESARAKIPTSAFAKEP